MKKHLLFIISLLILVISSSVVFAYETLIIDFPPKTKWDVVFYRHIGTEAILQYVPAGQTYEDWTQTVIVHSYKENTLPATQLSDMLTRQMKVQNPTGNYRYVTYTPADTIAVRNTDNYQKIKGHGEIFRTTRCAEGRMTIQYIDRDKENFRKNYGYWLKVIRDARTYNSYWRDERIMNKGEFYEL